MNILAYACHHPITSQSATVNVTVFVSDVNDNSPQFTLPGGYQFSVVEEVAGLTVGAVKVNQQSRK